jgi:hypothetical protein
MKARILAAAPLVLVCLAPAVRAQTTPPTTGRSAAASADANGFKVCDRVQILTGFGWIEGTILATRGNDYRVRAQTGIELTKRYPDELRRIGVPTAADKAAGQYALHDKVQVNVNGAWLEGEITTTLGLDYQVSISGNRLVWVSGKNLRPSAAASPAPVAAKSGVPPKPGLTSCAGKIEGRYATTGGFGTMTIVFRSGKAIMKDGVSDNDTELECWMGGGKLYLHKPGDSAGQDMPLDINDDGTLQSPFGEMKRKGSS